MSRRLRQQADDALNIWRFVDGKPGHDRQSEGLVQALADLCPVKVHVICPSASARAVAWTVVGRFPPGRGLPAPVLLVGAGHATHIAMLAARRARGGRVVVLMKPTLPLVWFDLCIVPEHDGLPASEHVLVTRGVLNCIVTSPSKDETRGLILIGGPSRHYGWDEDGLIAQLRDVIACPDLHWTLATSRRTPDSTLHRLQTLTAEGVEVVPWQATDRQWLPTRLASTAQVWVTEDSVSMIYEALTAGAACGLLAVPRAKLGRVSRGVDRLVADGMLTPLRDWKAGRSLTAPVPEFNEAARCAHWIHERWLARR